MPQLSLRNRLKRPVASALAMARTEARRVGLLDGQQDYTRFLILCRGRTGSNMLRSALNKHGSVVAYGELFRKPGLIGWDQWPYLGPASGHGQYRHLLRLVERDPIAFLQRYVYGRQPRGARAVGFKMFYYYAHQPHWEPVWEHLRADTGLRVIHLKRRNRLRTLLSQTRADQDGQWLDLNGARRARPAVPLDPAQALRFFEQNEQWEREYARHFGDHPLLDVFYEDLVRDFDAEMRRVQAFLGVPYRPAQPRTHRQSHKPLSQAIANYAELEAAFADTRWAAFFDAAACPAD